MVLSNDRCDVFEGASVANFVFSVLITFGIFISYLPQYRRIFIKKTSEGLSTNFLLLGSCSSIFTFTNIVLVSSKARSCCSTSLSVFNCINSQLNLLQIGTQSICAVLILVVVLSCTRDSIRQDKHEYAKIVKVGQFVTLHAIVSLVQIAVGLNTNLLYPIAEFNGLMSTTLTVIKYVPQIYTTYKLKHPGSLSVGMMCIQTPGGFVFTATLYFTKGSHWSSWVSYLAANILQGSLLSLCIYYQKFRNDGIDAQLSETRAVEDIIEDNTAHAHNQHLLGEPAGAT